MIRTAFLLWLAMAGAAFSQSVVEQVVSQLQQQGYTAITVSRTFLGRTRIQASSPSQSREIVMNAASGEILRDVWQKRSGATTPGVSISPGVGNSTGAGTATDGGARADQDRDDDDDDGGRGRGRGRGRGGDDDDRSDNSGSGSDNSGSGSDGDDD